MFKKILVVFFLMLILCSCNKEKHVACILQKDNKSIQLDIDSTYDDIQSIKARVVFVLPNDLMADDVWLEQLNSQLDDTYHYEDNNLVSEYELPLNDTYSLSKTVEYLRKEKYFCE